MEFFFNELSIHEQFSSANQFVAAVEQFKDYRTSIHKAGHSLYIHRNIFDRPVLKTNFRRGLQMCFRGQQLRTLMSWLSKSGSFLPDESYAAETDEFICCFPKETGKKNCSVKNTALAECTFRQLLETPSCSISLENSQFNWTPIHIAMNGEDETDIDNDFSCASLESRLDSLLPPISSWEILIERIANLPNIVVEADVLENLKAHPFAKNVAQGILVCTNNLSEITTASSRESFNELIAKYASGLKARFSDSSDDEKRTFKESLSFNVDEEKQLCSYHGKIKMQQYRVHIVDRPRYNTPARIVYIGPKLTKR